MNTTTPNAVAVLALLKECSWLDANPCDIDELADAKEQALAVLAAAETAQTFDAALAATGTVATGADYYRLLDALGVRQ